MNIQEEISLKIKEDFKLEEVEAVKKIIRNIIRYGSNTGVDQVLRSILYLSEGDLRKVKKYYEMYCDDPRDVVGEAEQKAGNPGHWFSIPFDEMDDFAGELPKLEKEKSEDDNLPFLTDEVETFTKDLNK